MFLKEREGPEEEGFIGVETGLASGFFSIDTGLLYRSKLLSIPIPEGLLSSFFGLGSSSLELESESLELEEEEEEEEKEVRCVLELDCVRASERTPFAFDSPL